ncbi:acyltransferase family protein [Acidicapsa dinghuensis]|uniref:Acyltransferase family protein n=1 Tax=Acidicapsa dinghuensis TaxID=2218256 RepID=A0ABW1EM53_9BACT|nr:acyltransferase [Acidicapsa dinghuensis]
MPKPIQRAEKIHALTSLRFFAAFYVVLYHANILGLKESRPGSFAERFVSFGYISVSFFFLLSGYILAVVYLRDSAQVRKKPFYMARFARIYPLFLVTLILDTPQVLLERVSAQGWMRATLHTGATFAAHLLMLQAWLPKLHGIDQPNWSLSVETVFYLIFPFIGVALWRLKGSQLWFVAAMLWLLNQIIIVVVAPHIAETTFRFHPLPQISTFALGILLARWQFLNKQAVGNLSERDGAAITALLFALGTFAALICWGERLPLVNLNAGLLFPVFALLIWSCSGSHSLPARLLSAKWLVVLGEASFGLYLIHVPILHLFLWLRWGHSWSMFALYLATCIGLSVLSFYFVEGPSRRWILNRFRTRPRETMEMASDAQ